MIIMMIIIMMKMITIIQCIEIKARRRGLCSETFPLLLEAAVFFSGFVSMLLYAFIVVTSK